MVPMAQVVRNLLSNAVKLSPDGGRMRIDINEDDEGIRTSLHDRGMGVPEDELERTFDEFVQSSKTRTGAGRTGLGLSIYCENHPEGGAVFHMVLLRTMEGDSPKVQPERLRRERADPSESLALREQVGLAGQE